MIAVKIDNTAAGLPQFNVADADLVYVEQVEGGLTRLMAVYHTTLPREVGAVRSVRSTDAELLPVFGTPALVFSGGADGPLNALAATPTVAGLGGLRRCRVLALGRCRRHLQPARESAGDRRGASRADGPYDIGLRFAADDPRVAAAPAATSLAVQYQAARTEFAFTDGRYRLLRDGTEQSDASGAPIVADNVLFQSVGFEPDGTVDSVGSPSYISHTVGSGTFGLFRDGHRIAGKWSRPAADQPTQYLDARKAGAAQAGKDLGGAGAADRVRRDLLTTSADDDSARCTRISGSPGCRVDSARQADATRGDAATSRHRLTAVGHRAVGAPPCPPPAS